MLVRALESARFAVLLTTLTILFLSSPALAASDMVWSFTEGNDASNRGRMTARLGYGVPETDNVQIDGVCEARGGTSVMSANLILGADVGKLADDSNVNVRFTGGGFNHFVSGSVYGTRTEEGITGVSLDVKVSDPLWKALTEQDSLDYLVPGYSASKLGLKGGRDKIRQFIRACRSYAEALVPEKTAKTEAEPKKTAQYQTAAGPGKKASPPGGVTEKEAYEAAKELGTLEAWEAFLNSFPTGFRADLARAYVKRLGVASPASPPPAQKVTAAPPPPPPPPGPADISITQTSNQGACKGGDSCSYTMVATNTGGTAFTGQLVIANSLTPRGAKLTSTGNAPWFCQGMGGGAVCTSANANLAPGASTNLSLTFKLPRNAGSSITSCSSISWGGAPTGSSVRDVQSELSRRGFNPGPADGQAGRRTIKAIREFQGRNGLQPSGEIDLPLLIALFTTPGAGDANPGNDQACAGSAVTPAPLVFTPTPALPAWQPPRGRKAVTRKGPAGKCSSRSVWLEGKCILKSAVASYCGPGFHRAGSNCVSNANRATTAPGTGKCSSRSVWLEGQCIAKSQVMSFCGPGYHRDGSKCVSNANRAATAPRGGQQAGCPSGQLRVGNNCVNINVAPLFGKTRKGGGQTKKKPKPGLSAAQIYPQLYNACVAAGIGVAVRGGCRGLAAGSTKDVLGVAPENQAAAIAQFKGEVSGTKRLILKYQQGGGKITQKPKPGLSKPQVYTRIFNTCVASGLTVTKALHKAGSCQELAAMNSIRVVNDSDPANALARLESSILMEAAQQKARRGPKPTTATRQVACQPGFIQSGKNCVPKGPDAPPPPVQPKKVKTNKCPGNLVPAPGGGCMVRKCASNQVATINGCVNIAPKVPSPAPPPGAKLPKLPKPPTLLTLPTPPQATPKAVQQKPKIACTGGGKVISGRCVCPSNRPRLENGKCKKPKGNQFIQPLQQPQNQPRQPQTQPPPQQNQGQQQLQNLLNQFSDARLKRDIEHLATLSSGIRLYAFRYLWEDTLRVGVMAQDLLANPAWRDAVSQHASGYYMVDYAALGLRMVTLEDWRARGLASVQIRSADGQFSPLPVVQAQQASIRDH